MDENMIGRKKLDESRLDENRLDENWAHDALHITELLYLDKIKFVFE